MTPDTPVTYTPDLSSLTDSILTEHKAAETPETPPTTVEAKPEPAPEPTPTPTPEPRDEKGYMLHADYTRKTMELAEERKAAAAEKQRLADERAQWENQRQLELAQRQQEYFQQQQLIQQLNDPDYLRQREAALRQHLNLPQADQQPTAQQVQVLLARQRQDLEQVFDRKLQDTLTRHSIEQMKFDFGNQIQNYQKQLLKEFPDLEVLGEGLEKVITTQAMGRQPKTLDEAKSVMRELAEERVAKFQKRIADSEQAAIMRHAKSQKTTMEPRGGTAPAVQVTPKNVRLGSKELESLILSDLAQELAK